MQRSSGLSPAEYSEKVYYCRSCHSLHILVDDSMTNEDWDGAYCAKCGSVDVGECPFGKWLEEEERREERQRRKEWSR